MEWMIIAVAVFVVMRMVGGRGCGWRGYRRGDLPERLQDRIARRAERRARRWGGLADGEDRRREALEHAADRLDAASARLRDRAHSGSSGEMGRGTDGDRGTSGARSLQARGNGNGARPSGRAAPVTRKETPLEELQRRFADGRISMEQYERELDELLGLGA